MSESKTHSSGPATGGQALLKRNPGLSIEGFRKHYIGRHARIAIPWCLANGVSYYAQIHKPLHWTTPELETKYTALGVNLQDWDAVAEMVFPPIVTIEDYYRAKVGKAYHFSVITPDERRFLLDEALKHLQGVEPGAVDGERVELIVEGRSMVDVEEWQRLYDKIETNDRASQQKTACKLSVEVDSNLP